MRQAVVLLLLLASCAADRTDDGGDPPGQSCESDVDCNREDGGATRSCGLLRLCIVGRCERIAGTQVKPCPAGSGS